MGESSTTKGLETREFWNEAIRLWTDSGLSVRKFCLREGLTEHSFYAWRRALLPETLEANTGSTSSAKDGSPTASMSRQRRKRKPVAVDVMSEDTAAASFIELATPRTSECCRCTLELEDAGGAKMRIQLRSVAMPDLAAISQRFWNRNRPP